MIINNNSKTVVNIIRWRLMFYALIICKWWLRDWSRKKWRQESLHLFFILVMKVALHILNLLFVFDYDSLPYLLSLFFWSGGYFSFSCSWYNFPLNSGKFLFLLSDWCINSEATSALEKHLQSYPRGCNVIKIHSSFRNLILKASNWVALKVPSLLMKIQSNVKL